LTNEVWTQTLFDLADGPDNFILCRLSLKEDPDLGLSAPAGIVLPIINEYFTLSGIGLEQKLGVEKLDVVDISGTVTGTGGSPPSGGGGSTSPSGGGSIS